jgi:hypothetical protein
VGLASPFILENLKTCYGFSVKYILCFAARKIFLTNISDKTRSYSRNLGKSKESEQIQEFWSIKDSIMGDNEASLP